MYCTYWKINVKTIFRMLQCVQQSGLNVDDIYTCYTSQEGHQLMLIAENKTKIMTPEPFFVPTIVFDDVCDNIDILHIMTNFIIIYFLFCP